MECSKCHLIIPKSEIKTFTCDHNICNYCFLNIIMKEIINNMPVNQKSFFINCKCGSGKLNFDFNDLKKIKISNKIKDTPICPEHKNKILFYCKTEKRLICKDCVQNPTHEKISLETLKTDLKTNFERIKFKTYTELKKYQNSIFENFLEKIQNNYNEEIEKLDNLINEINLIKEDLKNQMNDQIEHEKILFHLIDMIYKINYDNFKILNTKNVEKYGYRFFKSLSKIKFDFGEYTIYNSEEIIPQIEKIQKDIKENLATKKLKVKIKYPYFEIIKSFTPKNEIKQNSIITCIGANKLTNEIAVGFRDYTINIFSPSSSSYELYQTINEHKKEISSINYLDNYLLSASRDKTVKIWSKELSKIPETENKEIYILKQTIDIFNNEITRINIYNPNGFFVVGEENSFRLFLKKNIEEDQNIFEKKLLLTSHDGSICDVIQIKKNNDLISGSKDMTLVVWKDKMNNLNYESEQIISAGNEVTAVCQFGDDGFAFGLKGNYEIKICKINNDETKYEICCVLNEQFWHSRIINQIILLKDNRLASCSYDSTVKIFSFNQLNNELRQDQELDQQDMSVNGIAETGNGKLITGGHGKKLIIYNRV